MPASTGTKSSVELRPVRLKPSGPVRVQAKRSTSDVPPGSLARATRWMNVPSGTAPVGAPPRVTVGGASATENDDVAAP